MEGFYSSVLVHFKINFVLIERTRPKQLLIWQLHKSWGDTRVHASTYHECGRRFLMWLDLTTKVAHELMPAL